MTKLLRLLWVLLTLTLCPAIAQVQPPSSSADCIALDRMAKAELGNGRQAETLPSQALAPGASRAEHACAAPVLTSMTIQAACTQLSRAVLPQLANQGAVEAERIVLAAAANGPGPSCVGLILTDLASIAAISGRLDDAATLAQHSIQQLQQEHSANDPILLRPLHFIAYVRLEHGEAAKAREIIHRMQSIRSDRLEDQKLLHYLVASLMETEGRYREAESEYVAGLSALERGGLGGTIDAGSFWIGLSGLYIKERRLEDASRALDRAFAISNSATDVVRGDRMSLLLARGVLLARRHDWAQAERDLHDSLTIADGDPRLDPHTLRSLLVAYAQVLRKNHHSGEARSIEMRVAALPRQAPANVIVDVTELAGRAGLKK